MTRVLALLLWVGCGPGAEPPEGGSDGSLPDAGGTSPTVAPPDIPWLAEGAPPIAAPMLTPCPDGWREVAPTVEGDTVTCDPYPVGGPSDCPAGWAHFPGDSGCTPVGAPCPAGDFSERIAADATVVYVRPGETGGDGTLARPFGSYADIDLSTLAAGAVIALSRGTHVGWIRLDGARVLQGACAAATALRAVVPHATHGVVSFAGDGTLRDATVGDSPRGGLLLSGSATNATLEGVIVARSTSVAVLVAAGARLSADELVLQDTALPTSGAGGRTINLQDGSRADVRRALVARNPYLGVYASDPGTELGLTDVAVTDTEGSATLSSGHALFVQDGARLTASRVLLARNRDEAVHTRGAGSTSVLSDAVVRDTRPRLSDAGSGRAIGVQEDATVDVSRALLSRSAEAAVFVGPLGAATLSDLVVVDTLGNSTDGGGEGLSIRGIADVRRALSSRNRSLGVVAHGGADLTMQDAVIRDTRSRMVDGTLGRGLQVQLRSRAGLTRLHLVGNRDIAASVAADATAVMSDVSIEGTLGREADGLFGRGLAVEDGAIVEGARVILSRNLHVGLFGTSTASVTMSDLVVRDTAGRAADGDAGRAISLQYEATATVRRAMLMANRELGFVAVVGVDAELEDVLIADTRAQDCAESTCAGSGAGHGVGSYGSSAVRVSRFRISSSALCGVHVARDAGLDLADGVIDGQPIGACVQVDGYDTNRLTSGVRFQDNGVNLQTTTLPVPDPTADF